MPLGDSGEFNDLLCHSRDFQWSTMSDTGRIYRALLIKTFGKHITSLESSVSCGRWIRFSLSTVIFLAIECCAEYVMLWVLGKKGRVFLGVLREYCVLSLSGWAFVWSQSCNVLVKIDLSLKATFTLEGWEQLCWSDIDFFYHLGIYNEDFVFFFLIPSRAWIFDSIFVSILIGYDF